MMGEITLDEVNAAIRRYLDPDDMVIAMVTSEAQELAAALADDRPSPITYETPKPDEVWDEDALISCYELGIDREDVTIVPVDEMFAD